MHAEPYVRFPVSAQLLRPAGRQQLESRPADTRKRAIAVAMAVREKGPKNRAQMAYEVASSLLQGDNLGTVLVRRACYSLTAD